MSEGKFTKGPWVYESRSSLVIGDDEVAIVPEDDDGHLIACAPEMYKFLDDLANGRGTDYPIEQLLAKARGEHEAKD